MIKEITQNQETRKEAKHWTKIGHRQRIICVNRERKS